MDELSYLLWATQGLKSEFTFFGRAWHRTVPSSGGKHPFETYLTISRVDGLRAGLYRYVASRHALICVDDSPDVLERTVAAAGSINRFVKGSAVVFTWVAVPDRMTWFATDRGYRNLYLDGGHVGQNVYLCAQQVGCGVCAMCMFEDVLYNELVGVDGVNQFVIYACAIGKTKPGSRPAHASIT
jgi:SagB-type dehydrogenase family enzyme